MKYLFLLLCVSCGAQYFDCQVDESKMLLLAQSRDVVETYERMDFFCEPRREVQFHCRNQTAEACTAGTGSVLARGRSYYSDENIDELPALIEHEMTHWQLHISENDDCAKHPPKCDGLPQ